MIAKQKSRKLKVYEGTNKKCNVIPEIKMKGLWLRQAGFEAGDYFVVSIKEGVLQLTIHKSCG